MTQIFYFSGTGNSYSTAAMIGDKLDGEVNAIAGFLQKGQKVTGDVIGIVAPVYCYDIPGSVKRFLETADFPAHSYIFLVLSCGGHAGFAAYSAKQILEKRNVMLAYSHTLKLPDNSVIIKTAEETKKKMFDRQKKSIIEIVEDVRDRRVNVDGLKKKLGDSLTAGVLNFAVYGIYGIKNKKVDHKTCRDCGICIKVCPTDNISREDGRYSIGKKKCDDCFACMHWCPEKSISVGMVKLDEASRYHHPDVSLKDMIRK